MTAELGGDERTVYRHGGGIFGLRTQNIYVPVDAYTVVVLDNTEGAADAVAGTVMRTLYGEEVERPKQAHPRRAVDDHLGGRGA